MPCVKMAGLDAYPGFAVLIEGARASENSAMKRACGGAATAV